MLECFIVKIFVLFLGVGGDKVRKAETFSLQRGQ